MLLIGIGSGLILAFAAVLVPIWYHHMFIMGFSWQPGSIVLALPFVLILVGAVLLFRERRTV
jgi:hypothetical protein